MGGSQMAKRKVEGRPESSGNGKGRETGRVRGREGEGEREHTGLCQMSHLNAARKQEDVF